MVILFARNLKFFNMIVKIKNFMNSTTDLVSYSDEDDYSNFWKDLKPIKYESPIEILKKHHLVLVTD